MVHVTDFIMFNFKSMNIHLAGELSENTHDQDQLNLSNGENLPDWSNKNSVCVLDFMCMFK